MNRFINIHPKAERGFTLFETLIVMVILALLMVIGYRNNLIPFLKAEALGTQAATKAVYDDIRACSVDNEALVGDFDYILSEACLDSTSATEAKVDNKVTVTEVDTATRPCWDTRIAQLDASGQPSATAAERETYSKALAAAAVYGSGTNNGRKVSVNVCTFNAPGVGANGVSTQQDNVDSRYLRVSSAQNGKAYFYILDSNGFKRCNGPVDASGIPTDKLTCRN